MKKIVAFFSLLICLSSCKKNNSLEPTTEKNYSNDLFVYPVDAQGSSLCVGKMYLYNSDTTELLRAQDFDCNEETKFYFSNVEAREYILKVKSQNLIGFAKVEEGKNGIEVRCE